MNCGQVQTCKKSTKMIPLVFYLTDDKKLEGKPQNRDKDSVENLPRNGMYYRPMMNIVIDFSPPPTYNESDDEEC